MERDSFVFYKSFYDAIKELDDQDKLIIYTAIFEYTFYGNEIELTGICKGIFALIKPQIDANNKRYSNGKKGGRPKKEEEKTNGYENKKPMVIEEKNQKLLKKETNGYENKKPNVNDNVNVNVNVNVNDNDNIKEKNIIKKEKNKYGKFGRVKLTDDEYERLVKEFTKDFIDNQIELLDEYVESNNNKNKYTNFNLVLRKSIRENWFNKSKKENKQKKEADVPKWFYMDLDKKEEMSDEDKRELEQIKNGTYKP